MEKQCTTCIYYPNNCDYVKLNGKKDKNNNTTKINFEMIHDCPDYSRDNVKVHNLKRREIIMEKSTYEMYYKCWNCKRIFRKDLAKGTFAYAHGGECPNCGAKDDVITGFSDVSHTHTPIENE